MALVKAKNPALGFEFNWRAYKANPWDWLIRYQLMLTFMDADGASKIEISRADFDRIYQISASATPFSPLLLYGKQLAEEKRGWK